MTEFKVGDKVNVLGSTIGPFYGTVLVAEDCKAGLNYRVLIEGGEAFLTHPNEAWWVYRANVVPAERPFKLGDVVQLTCGGKSYTITDLASPESVYPRHAVHDSYGHAAEFDPECLVLVKAVDE